MVINYKKALLNMIDSFMFNNGLNDTICWLYSGGLSNKVIASLLRIEEAKVEKVLEEEGY